MTDQGPSLRAWREKAGLSPETVAGTAGVSLSTLKNWEQGKSSPRTEHVQRMTDLAPGLLLALGLEGPRRAAR